MEKLNIEQLHQLRLSIFDNAESLHKEAKLLYENEMFARAYLLAHFACEELGKIPIIVGAIGQLIQGEDVDWKKVGRRFRNHKEKVISENHHHYVFGIEIDLINDSDLNWLNEQNKKSHIKVENKNRSTYVDVLNGKTLLPHEQVTQEDAKEMIEITFKCLSAHWQSESLTNPIVRAANNAN
jgi:AbiV family abortive infection protein